MSRKQKKQLRLILIAAALFIIAAAVDNIFSLEWWVRLIIFAVPYAVIGYKVLIKAAKNISHGQVFDENFLMAIASVGAMCIGEYPEAIAVMLFYQVGELFEGYSVGKSREAISDTMNIRPDYANLEIDGEISRVDPAQVKVGDVITVAPGEKIPLDGVVIEGESAVDTAALTGESVPVDVKSGDDVISGCINMSGVLRVKVTTEFHNSTVSRILDLVENSSMAKARTENLITKFARFYTPAVVAAAVLLAAIPPLFSGEWIYWINTAIVFLVISCPCALVISVPLSFFGGIGGASRHGILAKGSNYLEALAKVDTVVFDKTGTLTKGCFTVTAVHPEKINEKELLELAATAEHYSSHPISLSLKSAHGEQIDASRIGDIKEVSGKGVIAEIDGKTVCAGNSALMESAGADWHDCHHIGTIVHVCVDGDYAGHIVISDEIKPDSRGAVVQLKNSGIKTVMLTGDRREVAQFVKDELGLDEMYAELLPDGKVEKLEQLLAHERKGRTLAFVGDGINDAPVLMRSDVGIAMGSMGSDAAIEAADIVLMDDKPSKIALAIRIAKRTLAIAKQNIVFALAVKFGVMAVGVAGVLGAYTIWAAVFADVGVSVIAILNAMRTMRIK